MLKHLRGTFTEFKANIFNSVLYLTFLTVPSNKRKGNVQESLQHACEIPVDKAFAPASPPTVITEQRNSLNTKDRPVLTE